MPSYRLEEASTGRAGCQNKECKDAKVKILKGELRLGTWVDTERFQSFFWRHWGCTTPKIIGHIKETIDDEGDGDLTTIDGFEDLSEENQDKVRKAVEQGHVDDEDWKGDVEMNRPGKSGFRQRATKKKAKANEEEESAEEKETPKPKKRTAKAARDEESEDEAPKPKKPKKAGRPKKAAESEGSEGEAATPAKSKAKPAARKGRAAAKETPEKKAPAAKTGGRRQKKATENDGDAEAQAEPEPEPDAEEKPKRGRKKKSA